LDCKDAHKAIAGLMSGELGERARRALDEHLASCAACAERRTLCERVRESLGDLSVPELTPEMEEALRTALESARKPADARIAPPANPKPTEGFLYRAVVFALVMGGLALVYLLLVLFAGKYYEAPPETARVVYRSGGLLVGYPGSRHQEDAQEDLRVTGDIILVTAEDGAVKLETPGATWWLDRSTAMSFRGGDSAAMAGGRVLVECRTSPEAPATLETHTGLLTCASGRFVVRLIDLRLQVTCIEGEVALGRPEAPLVLTAGQRAFVARGVPLEPVRTVRTAWASAWTKRFYAQGPGGMPPVAAALLPVRSAPPLLPRGVRVKRLDVKAQLRGPLVVLTATAKLENGNDETWTGRLQPEHLLWPTPICSVPSAQVEIDAGERAEVECAALAVMRSVAEENYLALTPAGWTGEQIGEFSLSLSGSAQGIESASCCTHDVAFEQTDGAVSARYRARDLPPELPVMLRFVFEESAASDLLLLPEGEGEPELALVAVRLGFSPSKSILKTRSFILAFDAGGRYERVGYGYAQQVADEICSRLLPDCSVRVAAYDGKIKVLAARAGRFGPLEAERMLAGLWSMDNSPQPSGAQLLRWLGKLPCEKPTLAFLITDERECVEAFEMLPAPGQGPRVLLAQLGADEHDRIYGSVCGAGGGSCTAVRSLSPAGAATLLLSNLPWPGLRIGEFSGTEGIQRAQVLTTDGTPANQPVIAVIRPKQGARRIAGVLNLMAAEAREQQRVTLPIDEGDRVTLSPALASALRAYLAKALE